MQASREQHLIARIGWLRAAVLGANDGIISTGSLMLGVAVAATSPGQIFLAGLAGLVAGAMSMAAGEFVSVNSQSDTEKAELKRESEELAENPEFEKNELAQIYVERGLSPELAQQVAAQLMAKDALAAHARDELGMTEVSEARPLQAALASAVTFAAGAAIPFITALLSPPHAVLYLIPAVSIVALAALGALGAKLGGAAILKPTARVAFWGAFAMAVTAGVGALVGHSV
ncbi:VIT family protein [uncultured Methylovirgula sp.]|uniref:VIT1/CCC1 transporter family protein n=1 Tax=uncultured Methylovirgula sp. TaxID=1285960 RepID=UPI00261E1B25|nr:VIT family protein [uncultured Methylovirgula sp.]